MTEQCSICYDSMEYCTELSCGHRFHINCLNHWRTINNTCPMCRTEVNIARQSHFNDDNQICNKLINYCHNIHNIICEKNRQLYLKRYLIFNNPIIPSKNSDTIPISIEETYLIKNTLNHEIHSQIHNINDILCQKYYLIIFKNSQNNIIIGFLNDVNFIDKNINITLNNKKCISRDIGWIYDTTPNTDISILNINKDLIYML